MNASSFVFEPTSVHDCTQVLLSKAAAFFKMFIDRLFVSTCTTISCRSFYLLFVFTGELILYNDMMKLNYQ